jgi:hypothetical protein
MAGRSPGWNDACMDLLDRLGTEPEVRAFVTRLSAADVRTRAKEIARASRGLRQGAIPVAADKTHDRGFEYMVWGRNSRIRFGIPWYGVSIRGGYLPVPGGTRIDVTTFVRPRALLGGLAVFALLPTVLLSATLWDGLAWIDDPAGWLGRLAAVVWVAVVGSAYADYVYCQNPVWIAQRDVVGRFMRAFFEATEVPLGSIRRSGGEGRRARPPSRVLGPRLVRRTVRRR